MKIRMLNRAIGRFLLKAALVPLIASGACTAVEYGYIDTGNGDKEKNAKVVFGFDWSNAGTMLGTAGSKNENTEQTPSLPKMYVAMSRIVNEEHYVYLFDPSESTDPSTPTGPINPTFPTDPDPDSGNDGDGSGTGDGSENGSGGSASGTGDGSENGNAGSGSGTGDGSENGNAGSGSETGDGGENGGEGGGPETPSEEPQEESYDLSVHNGNYYLAAFGCLPSADNLYTYENLQNFESDNSVGMSTLYANVSQMNEDEFREKFGNLSVDFNPSYPIIHDAAPLLVDVRKMSLYNDVKPIEVLFKPVDLTMTIVFRVRVNIEDTYDEPVEIKDISAEISGVPAKVQLMSGIITADNLCKVPFKMEKKSESGGGTTQNGRRSRQAVFEGSVRVFGLFTSEYGTYISGPGILRLAVNAVAGKDEQTDGKDNQTENMQASGANAISGKAVERIFYAGINLKRVIEEAKPVVRLDNGTGYRAIHVVRHNDESGFSSAGNKPITIEVPDALNVSKDNVVSGGGDGLEQWFESDRDISTEV